jgi:hypothetical protein
MTHTDYRTLLSQGRKAGLRTSELYSAMSARRVGDADQGPGQADCNGFVSSYNQAGQRIYRPISGYPRS